MLYPKNRKLDPGINSELRILKTEDQRINTLNLLGNIKQYTQVLDQLASIEMKIINDISKLYHNDSVYGNMIYSLSNALNFKADLIKRESKALKDSLEKNKGIADMYNPLKPLIKHYFKSIDENQHYIQKLPKVIDQMEGKKKIKGELTQKETEKIIRNKRKFENAQTDLKVVHESIFDETNKLNLERFDKLNPIIKEFINSEVSLVFLMSEKFAPIDNFDAVLSTKESELFNHKYFMDVKSATKSEIQKSGFNQREGSKERSQVPTKQNIQNNYYYVNSDGKEINRFNPESMPGSEGMFKGSQGEMPNSTYIPNNNSSNMMSYQQSLNSSPPKPLNNNSMMGNSVNRPNNDAIALPYQ